MYYDTIPAMRLQVSQTIDEMSIQNAVNVITGNIRTERLKQGITQVHLAEMAGLGIHQICNIEKGKRKPTIRSILLVCHALKIKPEQIFLDVFTDI